MRKNYKKKSKTIFLPILVAMYLMFSPCLYAVGFHKTLSSWAQDCFKNLPEGRLSLEYISVKAGGIPKNLQYEQLAEIVRQITQRYTQELQEDKKFAKNFNVDYFDVDEEGFLTSSVTGSSYFVQKLFVPSGSHIALIGDMHGSVTSLLRNLIRMALMGYIDNNFKLKDNVYLVFLGDLVDRGWYGVEIWYTIMLLKLANWDHVYILQGNHDSLDTMFELNILCGFAGEFKNKYGNKKNIIQSLYRFLPAALFLGSGKSYNDKDTSWVQCCHGGLMPSYNPKKFIAHKAQIFEYIDSTDDTHECFNWSDFILNGDDTLSCHHRHHSAKKYIVHDVQKYLEHNGLKAVLRGHQDRCFGLKMFPSHKQVKNIKTVLGHDPLACQTMDKNVALQDLFNYTYSGINKYIHAYTAHIDNKPPDNIKFEKMTKDRTRLRVRCDEYLDYFLIYWKDVISKTDQENPAGFSLSSYRPVYTSTTAIESQLVYSDFFALVTTAATFGHWRFKPYETNLLDAAAKVSWSKYNSTLGTIDSNVRNYVSVEISEKEPYGLDITYSKMIPAEPLGLQVKKTLEKVEGIWGELQAALTRLAASLKILGDTLQSVIS